MKGTNYINGVRVQDEVINYLLGMNLIGNENLHSLTMTITYRDVGSETNDWSI